MDEKDPVVLRADSVKVMTVFVAEAMRRLLVRKYIKYLSTIWTKGRGQYDNSQVSEAPVPT